jgi:hypothetical protein
MASVGSLRTLTTVVHNELVMMSRNVSHLWLNYGGFHHYDHFCLHTVLVPSVVMVTYGVERARALIGQPK